MAPYTGDWANASDLQVSFAVIPVPFIPLLKALYIMHSIWHYVLGGEQVGIPPPFLARAFNRAVEAQQGGARAALGAILGQ